MNNIILELGFKSLGVLWFKKDDITIRKWKDNELDIYYNLYKKTEEELISEFRVFRGKINTKEELIKVLEQTCEYK